MSKSMREQEQSFVMIWIWIILTMFTYAAAIFFAALTIKESLRSDSTGMILMALLSGFCFVAGQVFCKQI